MKRTAMKRKPRPSTPEERAWYAKVAKIPRCMICGSNGPLEIAHSNEHSSTGKKADYRLTCRLCRKCHYEVDNGGSLSLAQRRKLLSEAIDKTHHWLRLMGEME